jgi:cyclopropane fatty-acyl-phospholipid synthase-like methyltransferase
MSLEVVMGTVSFKENIKKYYDTEAELRNSKSVKVDWKVQVRGKFCELIKQENKKTLLELGAGAGYDSQFFMNNGLKVVAVDLSSEMVKNCREKSIEAYELDFYNLSSLGRKFDCIYAINTILHVPKNDLCHVLNEINLVLEKDGLFYMGLYGGQDTENEFIKSEVSDAPRFFAFHSDNYLKATLENYFELLDFETLDIGSGEGVNTAVDIFHSVTMRKSL